MSYRGTRFSAATGRWSGGKPYSNRPVPEGTRDERRWHTELPGGMIREDIGAPIPRLPSEPQAVSAGGRLVNTRPAPKPPTVTGDDPGNIPRSTTDPRAFKPGLGRG